MTSNWGDIARYRQSSVGLRASPTGRRSRRVDGHRAGRERRGRPTDVIWPSENWPSVDREHARRQQHPGPGPHLGVVRREHQVLRRALRPSARCPTDASRTSPIARRALRSWSANLRPRSASGPMSASPGPRPTSRSAADAVAPIAPSRSTSATRSGPAWCRSCRARWSTAPSRATPTSHDLRRAAGERPHRADLAADDREHLERRDEERVGGGGRGVELRLRRPASGRGPCPGSARPGRAGAARPGAGRARLGRGGGPGPAGRRRPRSRPARPRRPRDTIQRRRRRAGRRPRAGGDRDASPVTAGSYEVTARIVGARRPCLSARSRPTA